MSSNAQPLLEQRADLVTTEAGLGPPLPPVGTIIAAVLGSIAGAVLLYFAYSALRHRGRPKRVTHHIPAVIRKHEHAQEKRHVPPQSCEPHVVHPSKSQARQQGSPPFVIPSHPKARRGGFVHIPPNQHGHEHRGPIPHPQSQQRAPPHRPGHPLVPSRDVPAAPTHIEPVESRKVPTAASQGAVSDRQFAVPFRSSPHGHLSEETCRNYMIAYNKLYYQESTAGCPYPSDDSVRSVRVTYRPNAHIIPAFRQQARHLRWTILERTGDHIKWSHANVSNLKQQPAGSAEIAISHGTSQSVQATLSDFVEQQRKDVNNYRWLAAYHNGLWHGDKPSTTGAYWPSPAWSLDDVSCWFAEYVAPHLKSASAYTGYKRQWTHEYQEVTSGHPSRSPKGAIVHQTPNTHVGRPQTHYPLVIAQDGPRRKAMLTKAAAPTRNFKEGDQDIHDKMFLWHQRMYNRRLHAEMTQGCPYPVFTLPEHPPAVGHCSSKLVNPEKWIGPRYVHWTINGVDPSTAAIIWSHTNLPHFHELQDDSRQVACSHSDLRSVERAVEDLLVEYNSERLSYYHFQVWKAIAKDPPRMDAVPLEIMRYTFADKIAPHLENCPEEYTVWRSDCTIRNATHLNSFGHHEAAESDSTALNRTARDKSPSEESEDTVVGLMGTTVITSGRPSRKAPRPLSPPGAIVHHTDGTTSRDV